jgi:hypothetical protein
MKTKRFLKNSISLVLAGIAAVSCNDNEEKLEVLTDVYVINMKFDGEVKSATAYYAYANKSLMSATVAIPNDGGNVTLTAQSGSNFNLGKEPENSDFTATAPVEGSYSFTVKDMNGETQVVPDVLSYDGLAVPEFSKINFSGSPLTLETEWNAIPETDGYFIKMYNTSGKLIFSGYSVASNILKYSVTSTTNSGYWSEAAVVGQTYLLQINAYTNDAEANSTNASYNIQEVSVGESQITWGTNN